MTEVKVISILTATLLPPDTARNLLDVHKIDEEAYETFKWNLREGEIPTTRFHNKMKNKRHKA